MKFKSIFKTLSFFLIVFSTFFNVQAQVYDPVSWSFETKVINETETQLIIKATLEKDWHIYAMFLPSEDGPIATTIKFLPSNDYELIGATTESKYKTEFDPNFNMDLNFHENVALFTQTIKIKNNNPFKISGTIESMVCNAEMCLPPEEVDFSFNINGASETNTDALTLNGGVSKIIPHLPNLTVERPLSNCGQEKEEVSGSWMVFLFGFIGGLLALLTPCVFPMVPLTVSFFTKGGKDGKKGLGRAILYGFFIFLIYAALSIPFHFNTDPEVLNEIATSVWLNIIFFAVFLGVTQ